MNCESPNTFLALSQSGLEILIIEDEEKWRNSSETYPEKPVYSVIYVSKGDIWPILVKKTKIAINWKKWKQTDAASLYVHRFSFNFCCLGFNSSPEQVKNPQKTKDQR